MMNVRRTAKTGEICMIYGLNPGTLANLRSQKKGPRYYKQNRTVFYFLEDIETWLRQNPFETIDSVKEE
jgi:hypothetical protein